MPDWTAWAIGAAVVALMGLFFWHTGATIIGLVRQLVATVQNWPQIRRAMTEAEARRGGRYPPWLRALRLALPLALAVLLALLLWRKLAG